MFTELEWKQAIAARHDCKAFSYVKGLTRSFKEINQHHVPTCESREIFNIAKYMLK